ncbi:MAG: hypothetical protein GYA87_10275 [Christensenellaceae bacterium]|nr:hypothetical protein [Christensenellaceae bacterium]
MQDNTKKTKSVKIDYNIGKPFGKSAFKLGIRVFLSMFALIFVFLIFGSLLVFKNRIVSIAVNSSFIILCFYFMFMNGMSSGESNAAHSEIVFKKMLIGEPVDAINKDKCFHKLKGVSAVLIGLSPFLVLTIIFAAITTKQYYTLGSLPAWVNTYRYQTDLGLALDYYYQFDPITFFDILRVIVRASTMPFFSMFNDAGVNTIYLLEKLTPLLIMVVPSGFALGYTFGEKSRIKINASIKANQKRKNILNRKTQSKKAKEPKQLI